MKDLTMRRGLIEGDAASVLGEAHAQSVTESQARAAAMGQRPAGDIVNVTTTLTDPRALKCTRCGESVSALTEGMCSDCGGLVKPAKTKVCAACGGRGWR
jgi:hypothetical protein